MAESTVVTGATRLADLARAMFIAAGAPAESAERMAAALVDANLAGHDSHGVIRIPQYVEAIRSGEIVAAARPQIVQETEASAIVDGHWGFGQVTTAFATHVAVAKAKRAMLAAVGVIRLHHTGRLGEYPTMAAANGVVLLLFGGGLGGFPLAAPFGGRQAALGANPIAAGFPLGSGRSPLIVDFATTTVAEGKIRVARDAGQQLPPGAILNRDGLPTTNPNDFYNGGMLLPFGGHKGYGLALVAEMLTAALVAPSRWSEEGRGGPVFGRSGLFMLAIDPAIFGTRAEYERIAEETVAHLKSIPPAPGFDEVLIPGEPEARSRMQRLRDGIPLAAATWQAIVAAATDLGVDTAAQ